MKLFYLPIALFLSLLNLRSTAGDKIGYGVSEIPLGLLKDADVVLRWDETRFEVTGLDRAREYHKYAITVLNERGDKYAAFAEGYDKLHTIESIEGTLYDAAGKKVKSLKKQDISDYSGTGSELMSDDRVKVFNFYYKIYPYTVEYEVEFKYYYTLFYPQWVPQEGDHFAVQNSRLTVICPQEYKLRYKMFNYPTAPVVQTEKSASNYTWEIKDLPAVESEYASPSWLERTTAVYLGPDQFGVEGYQGNMNTWQALGKFVYTLKQGKDVLPDVVRQKVHELVDTVSDTREKIRRLYEFMQQNTHYIAVLLGIGGWQPFDAKYVAEKKYGDCKALSNYMYSLLKEAGIKSYYTLVKGGWEPSAHYMIDDFPSSQFNHVIVCVPLKADTLWLECTSQTLPAGYLGAFTSDRSVLLVDEEGSKLVHTPKYKLQDNLQLRRAEASVDADGNLTAYIHTLYKAEEMDDVEPLVNHLSKDKVMEILKSELDLPTYDVNKFDYREEKSALPGIYENLDLVASGYAQVSGKRLFINPNIMDRSRRRLQPDEKRKYDVVLYHESEEIDTVEIKIPAGYLPEAVPGNTEFGGKFGHYKASVTIQPDKIIYYRRLEKFSGRWPAAEYAELVKFYEQLYKADNSRLVLVKKE
jgi:hypothetical protein